MKIPARIMTPADDVVMEIDTDNDDFPILSVTSDGGKEIPAMGAGSVEELLSRAAAGA